MSSPRRTDISCTSSGKRDLSISLGPGISISPSDDFCDKKQSNISGYKQALLVKKTLKFKNGNRCWPSINRFRNQGPRMEFTNRKSRRKRRRNCVQWERKQTISTTDHTQKQHVDDKHNRLLTICTQKAKSMNIIENCKISPTGKYYIKGMCYKKRNHHKNLARLISSDKLTPGEKLEILMNKENMFFTFVTNHEGSRYLQETLISATTEQLQSTFNHIQPDFVSISKDVFGNYVAQKYLELGSDELRSAILKTLQPSILLLSVEVYGCRVVQKLLECGAYELKLLVAEQFTGSILDYVFDQNGNHVVQKIIQSLNPSDIGFIVDEISGKTYSLAKHPYGCRVIQQLLTKVSRARARPLLNEVIEHTIALSKNKYGNYIIQWVIKNCHVEGRELVLKLMGRVAELSRNKFASNVIELAFIRSSRAHISELAEELFQDELYLGERYPKLALLVNDQFGNYVIQTLLEASSGPFRYRLLNSLNKCGKLKMEYGKNLFLKVEKMLRNHCSDIK